MHRERGLSRSVVCDICGAEDPIHSRTSYGRRFHQTYTTWYTPDGWSTRLVGNLQQDICPQCTTTLRQGTIHND